jgi:hypothetical protein
MARWACAPLVEGDPGNPAHPRMGETVHTRSGCSWKHLESAARLSRPRASSNGRNGRWQAVLLIPAEGLESFASAGIWGYARIRGE